MTPQNKAIKKEKRQFGSEFPAKTKAHHKLTPQQANSSLPRLFKYLHPRTRFIQWRKHTGFYWGAC